MSRTLTEVLAGAGFAVVAAVLATRLRLGLSREIVVAAVRATAQLAAVGALVALVFRVPVLGVAFVAVMSLTAALTSGGRIGGVPAARRRAFAAIAAPALSALGILLLAGAFAATPRAAVPTAGILIGGAMAAATLTGRRLVEALDAERDEIEARLCLGASAREALEPAVRRAVRTGLIPVIDQTRSAGLVTLPGTFVGLVLGGASPETAAATQLVVLLALVAVELAAGWIVAQLIVRAALAPGERVLVLGT